MSESDALRALEREIAELEYLRMRPGPARSIEGNLVDRWFEAINCYEAGPPPGLSWLSRLLWRRAARRAIESLRREAAASVIAVPWLRRSHR